MRNANWRGIGVFLATSCLLVALGGAVGVSTVDPAFEPLVRRLTADGFAEAKLRRIFSRAEMVYSDKAMADKLTRLYMRKYGLALVADIQQELLAQGWFPGPVDGKLDRLTKWSIKAFQAAAGLPQAPEATRALLTELRQHPRRAPADLRFPDFTTPEVHEVVLTPERLGEAWDFYREHRASLARVRQRYGVPEEYLVALLAVETRVGRYLGDRVAVVNLASLAASEDPARTAAAFAYEHPGPDRQAWLARKAREKGEWAYRELRALLRYAAAQGLDPLAMPGSIYGAIGICQFMPSNALQYAVDGDGDGKADLFNVDDALMSLGNFLVVTGWRGSMSEAAKRRVFYAYNHSKIYVNTIMDAAVRLRGKADAARLPQ